MRIDGAGMRYRTREGEIQVLRGLDLSVRKDEFLVVRGPSGVGKTTLLLCLGGMLRPTSGRVFFRGADLYAGPSEARLRFRAQHLGFAFQTMQLLSFLTVVQNVALALRDRHPRDARLASEAILCRLGLETRLEHRPPQLSAGERQRVAVARAIVHRPELVLADEPTGNLDPASADRVIEHLDEYRREGGAVVLVTHSERVRLTRTRELVLEAGGLVSRRSRGAS